MADLPTPVTTNDELLAAIHGVLTQIRDRLPEPARPAEPGQPVELREPQDQQQVPAAPPAAVEPGAVEPEVVEAEVDEPEVDDAEQDPESTASGEDEPRSAAAPDQSAPAPPSVRASKGTWVEYAIAQGLDADAARDMSKADLIRHFRATTA